jgi:hypothetical protein
VYEFESSPTVDKIILVGPRNYNTAEGLSLANVTDVIALEYDASIAINALVATGSARSPILSTPEFGSAATYTSVRGRLHNLSAQIECLGTSTGLVPPGSVYIGTVPFIEGTSQYGPGTKSLKEAWAMDSIAVGYLKSHSAAGLVSKPVRVHSNIAETVAYKTWKDFVVPPTTFNLATLRVCNSIEPIVLYIPKAGSATTTVQYRLSLGQQWCSRWPNDPAMRATQVIHPPTSNAVWSEATSFLRSVGGSFAAAAAEPLGAAFGGRMAAQISPAAGLLA